MSVTLLSRCALVITTLLSLAACNSGDTAFSTSGPLRAEQNPEEGTISVYIGNSSQPAVVQQARPDFRPYLHPLMAPDGKGLLTEFSPAHHPHQTGIYWGFSQVNGRDYFTNPGGEYWRRVSATILDSAGDQVKWQTVYDLLDEQGNPVLTETQQWSMQLDSGKYVLNLDWTGEAKTDVVFAEYPYGGLFVRMPWEEGIKAEVVNAGRQRNERAEGQSATWLDLGMQVKGRDDMAHIAIFDHPDNPGYPQMWRVDDQFGVGPSPSRKGEWKIEKDQSTTIRHQLLVYTGEFNDLMAADYWTKFIGDGNIYSFAAMWHVAQQKAKEAKFLTPEEAVQNMTTLDGFKVNVFAAEPMIRQPMAFCWDDRGRLWIAENTDYESRGDGFSNDGNSRILILEDTDGDGAADSRKVFMENIPFPAAMAVGFDGLFLGAPPNLLFVPDRNQDDKADTKDIEIRLTGWGIRDRHETLNSFQWGPDGWLYGLQGFATPSKVRKPNGKARLYKPKEPFPEDILEGEGEDINGGVWRYHPTKDIFEVVAHGFSNPWGVDYDEHGQLFMTACVIPHLWHVVPGGIYQRQGGQHFNPYVYRDIQTITNHSHMSAHGGARVYLSDAFPEKHHGRLFMANIHEHGVLSDVLERKGSGFVGRHGDDFMMANNGQFVGFSIEIGPDGGVYVLDWHDADICGQEVLNKETGRVFRIMPEQSNAKNFPGRYSDLRKMSDHQLADLQTSPSEWHARRARVILQHRAAAGKLDKTIYTPLLKQFNSSGKAGQRLRAMWTLHVTGGLSPDVLIQALSDKDEYIRAWAIQLLCEDKKPPTAALDIFNTMARQDASPVVRLYLASALQRIDQPHKWTIGGNLMQHAGDSSDHNLPDMIWFGFEPLVKANPDTALSIAEEAGIPQLARFIARRAVDADAMEAVIAHAGKASKNQLHLLEGLHDAMDGRYDLAAPASWKNLYDNIRKSRKPGVAPLALAISQQFGDTEAAKQFLTTLKNKKAPVEQRQQALRALSNRQREELIGELPGLLDEPGMRTEAIRAIAAYDDAGLGNALMSRYASLNKADKLEAVQTMASRPRYGWTLAQAIAKKTIPKTDVPSYAARQLLRVVGSGFIEIWGPIESNKAEEQEFSRYKKLLTDERISRGNAAKGKTVFQLTCGPCHKMYDEGGLIGPDLTGSNRSNTDYLLSNILDPSGEIQDAYKMVVITTRDGRTYAGNVVSENERQVTMRVVGNDAVVINKSAIQSKEETSVSMMPEGLLNTLDEDQVVSLFAYMKTLQDTGK